MSFLLFTSKLIRFWILHSNRVRFNLFISCFMMVCLHGKVIVIIASLMFLLPSQLTYKRVSFNIECFKNFLPFSSVPFSFSGAQKSRLLKKNIAFGVSNYLNMRVTFNVFTCNGMIKLKIEKCICVRRTIVSTVSVPLSDKN